MNLICETNVFYDISLGHIKLSDFATPADTLYYSPISLLEIAGGIRKAPTTIERRKNSAMAILNSGALVLPTVDDWLATVFGYEPTILDEIWTRLVNDIPYIERYSHIDGLASISGTDRNLNIGTTADWRDDQEKNWLNSICRYLNHAYPPLAAYYRTDKNLRGAKPKIKGKDKKAFLADVNNNQTNVSAAFLHECAARAGQAVGIVFDEKSTEDRKHHLEGAFEPLLCYCSVMANFLVSLVKDNRRVEENDHLDPEFLPYLIDDEHILVTSEKKWADYCSEAGYSNRVRLIT